MLITPPLSLYIHMPWCVRKCPYCDFNSHALKGELPEAIYIDALLADLEQGLQHLSKRPIRSIFFGGGTPSLFSAKSLEHLFNGINKHLIFSENIEITLEANPGTVEYQRFKDYRSIGINRLSLGIQSFQADKLKQLGRIHNGDEAIRAVEAVHQAGFTNFNLDLMHGLPNQTIEDGLYDLQTALNLTPTHLSWYQLTLEPNTLFHKFPPTLPTDELTWEMQDQGQLLLREQGFSQYEISAYSKPDRQCQHNLNYWQFGDYLGIGAGAHSKITDISQQKIIRTWKIKNPKDYLNPDLNFIGETKIIERNELPFEFMLNALRLCEDISVNLFEKRTGLKLQMLETSLKNAAEKGLLNWNAEKIQITDLGRRFYNDLVEMFIS